MDALLLHRIHFAFTITYHYLFPQLTMGLGAADCCPQERSLFGTRTSATTKPPASGRRYSPLIFWLES